MEEWDWGSGGGGTAESCSTFSHGVCSNLVCRFFAAEAGLICDISV